MKSLKPQNIAVEEYKKRNFQEADANDAGAFHQSALLPNMPQRILSANVLKLQRMIGNKAVQRLLMPRMANATVVQRGTNIKDTNEHTGVGSNSNGILTITITDSAVVNGNITAIAVLDSDSNKIPIKTEHATINNDGDSVTITVNLNETEMDEGAKESAVVVMVKIGNGGSGDNEALQQEDANSNGNDNSTSKEFPTPKTEEDFTDEEADEEYLKADKAALIKEILRIGQEKVDNDDWDILPHNFKETRLSSLEIPQLKKLLAETKGSSDYQQVQNFLSNL